MFIFFKVASNVIVWTCRLRITNKKEAKSKKLKKNKQTNVFHTIHTRIQIANIG